MPTRFALARPAFALGAVGAALGCTSGAVAWLPFPGEDRGATSMILAVEQGDQLELYAYRLDPTRSVLRPPAALTEGARMTALLLGDPLEDLGGDEGRLPPAPAPNQTVAELDITASFAAVLNDGEISAWAETPGASSAILAFPVPLDPARSCPSFQQIELGRDDRRADSVLIPLPDRSALAVYAGEFRRFASDGSMLETAELAGTSAGARTSTAIFIFADRLYRAEIDPLRFEPIADAPDIDAHWMAAGPGDQLFTFGRDGRFGFFDGRRFDVVAELPIEGNSLGRGGALWLAPGEGAVANPAIPWVARFDGQLRADEVGPGVAGFGAAAESQARGPIVAETSSGRLYGYEGGGTWSVVPIEGVPAGTQVLTEYGEGIAWGGKDGSVGFATEAIDCGSQSVVGIVEIKQLAPLGEGLLAGGEDGDRGFHWIFLEKR